MTQQALANEMRERGHKWSQATVWSVEKGERPIRLTEAVDVAEILGLRVDHLLSPQAAEASRARIRLTERGFRAVAQIHSRVAELLHIQEALSPVGETDPSELTQLVGLTPEAIVEEVRARAAAIDREAEVALGDHRRNREAEVRTLLSAVDREAEGSR
jgi:hypothetical protein